jgi:hypothetical protein
MTLLKRMESAVSNVGRALLMIHANGLYLTRLIAWSSERERLGLCRFGGGRKTLVDPSLASIVFKRQLNLILPAVPRKRRFDPVTTNCYQTVTRHGSGIAAMLQPVDVRLPIHSDSTLLKPLGQWIRFDLSLSYDLRWKWTRWLEARQVTKRCRRSNDIGLAILKWHIQHACRHQDFDINELTSVGQS